MQEAPVSSLINGSFFYFNVPKDYLLQNNAAYR